MNCFYRSEGTTLLMDLNFIPSLVPDPGFVFNMESDFELHYQIFNSKSFAMHGLLNKFKLLGFYLLWITFFHYRRRRRIPLTKEEKASITEGGEGFHYRRRRRLPLPKEGKTSITEGGEGFHYRRRRRLPLPKEGKASITEGGEGFHY